MKEGQGKGDSPYHQNSGYQEGIVVVSDELLEMMREARITPGLSSFDFSTGKTTIFLAPQNIEKAKLWREKQEKKQERR